MKRHSFVLQFFILIAFVFAVIPGAPVYADNNKEGKILVKYYNAPLPELHSYNPSTTSLEEIISYWQSQQGVEFVQQNFDYQPQELVLAQGIRYGSNGRAKFSITSENSNDRFLSEQMYLKQIKALEAWDITTGSKDVVVAVIDTGLDVDHPDLLHNIWVNKGEIPNNGIDDDNNGYIDDKNGWDFNHNVRFPEAKLDSSGYTIEGLTHGTVVAGIIGAQGNNLIGISGIAQRVQIMGLKALNGLGHGTTLDVVKAILYAKENGADVINMSFVGHLSDDILKATIKDAYDAGIVIVAAVGNDGGTETEGLGDLDVTPLFPGCIDEKVAGKNWILGVASVDGNDRRSDFSSVGKTCVDLVAPGENIFSTQIWNRSVETLDQPYSGGWNGTSFAAPMVSGAAALVKNYAPGLSVKEIYDYIIYNSDSVVANNQDVIGKLGFGRLNIEETLKSIKKFAPVSVFNSASVKRKTKENTSEIFGVGAARGEEPWVRLWSFDGVLQHEFLAYNKIMKAGVNVALGDIDNDGTDEIITSPASSATPEIRVFDLQGNMLLSFFAFPKETKIGLNILAADVTGNGKDDIIVAAGVGGGPMIRVFRGTGELTSQFFAGDELSRDGVEIAVLDKDNNGIYEIAALAVRSGDFGLRMYNAFGGVEGLSKSEFSFVKGMTLAAGDFEEFENEMLVVYPAPRQAPVVRILDAKAVVQKEMNTFVPILRTGLTGIVLDTNNDGADEIFALPQNGGGPQVQILNSSGNVLQQFFVFNKKLRMGVHLGG